MLLREYAIEWWFIIPHLLTNVSALPRETWTRKLCLFSTPQACVHPHSPGECGECGWLWTEPVSYSKCSMWRPLAFPHHAATHIFQEKTHACGVLKRHNFRVHVSLGSAETLVRRCGIINHHSIAYCLSNISAKNYRNRLMWVESIVCNVSVVFLGHSVVCIINAVLHSTAQHFATLIALVLNFLHDAVQYGTVLHTVWMLQLISM